MIIKAAAESREIVVEMKSDAFYWNNGKTEVGLQSLIEARGLEYFSERTLIPFDGHRRRCITKRNSPIEVDASSPDGLGWTLMPA